MVSYRARNPTPRQITIEEFRFMQHLEIIPAVATKFEKEELERLNNGMRH